MNKMKLIVLFSLVGAFAATSPAAPKLMKVGGQGKVAFVNACNAPTNELATMLKKASNILMIDFELKNGAWSLPEAQKCFDAAKANAVIFIGKDKNLPMSLIAMESKWGFVNAEGLDGKSVMKESMRVALVLLGGAASRFPASMMRPVFSVDDLEKKAGEELTFDVVMPLEHYLPGLGVRPYKMLPRDVAIEKGLLKEDEAKAEK